MSENLVEELLKAGGVLPPGTEGVSDRAVPLVARSYRHPGLDDRVVVRLTAEELLAAEDLAAGFLGLLPEGEPAAVGFGQRRSLGFPEWILVHHPEDGHQALALVPELERAARQAKSKPKAALDAYHALAARLAASLPHFLPTFYEQAGRVFTGVENATYAGQMFSHARKAEARHGLEIDEERLDSVFLEFALAGALPVKVLSGYAKELAARLPAGEALDRFTRLCLRRTAGGLPPSAQMAQDLRKLARAAGQDADAAEQVYLTELLALPATLRAATGWWKAHKGALAALGKNDPSVRVTLLDVIPEARDHEMPGIWLEIIESSGAADDLVTGAVQPRDGATGWLTRFLAARNSAWGSAPHLPSLHALIERLAPHLRAGAALTAPQEVDLLDQLLALGIPVALPEGHVSLWLAHWAGAEERRDLVALEADGRFLAAFLSSAESFSDNDRDRRAIRLLAESPGGRPMLAEWVRQVARRSSAAGLPDLPDAMRKLAWLPGEALVLAEAEVREAAEADVAQVLARTLRAGLIDELSWPAWEDAAANLVPAKDVDDLVVADAWPHLIVSGSAQVRVLGPEGTALTHDLRVPSRDTWGEAGFHYVDGELLVYWQSVELDRGLRGYWHTTADRFHPLEGEANTRGTKLDWYRGSDSVTLALPGGGRTTGHGVLHRGDTAVPDERTTITDGTSYWVWSWDGSDHKSTGWYEFDPASGRQGRKAMPPFFADALSTAPDGSKFLSGWLLPAPSDAPTPIGIPANGLLGWRVIRLPDGSRRGEDLSGLTVTVPSGSESPVRPLLFPGAERACAIVQGSYRLLILDADGVVTSTVKTDATPGTFGKGTLMLPPVRYWNYLEPRDIEGSAVLRRIDGDTTAALIKAAEAADEKDLPAQIRALLPGVGHDGLVTGIAGVARFAAQQQSSLRTITTRLTETLAGDHRPKEPAGPADAAVDAAFNGLGRHTNYGWHVEDHDAVFRQIRAIGEALSNPDEPPAGPGRLHLDLPGLGGASLRWDPALDQPEALALRAATAITGEQDRATLSTLLGALHERGLPLSAEPERWRRMTLHLDRQHMVTPDGSWRSGTWLGILPLGDGAFIGFVSVLDYDGSGTMWSALHHDPAGRFEVPAPYVVKSTGPVGSARQAGWAQAFLAELGTRGPAPWRPEAAAEFARLTGVTPTAAKLVVAGMPQIDAYERSFLGKEERALIEVKLADAAVVRDELRGLDTSVRWAVVAALLPDDPAALWTDGPDVAAAAEVWNTLVGRQATVPEWLLGEAARALKTGWDSGRALRAVIDPATVPELSRDVAWKVRGDRVHRVDDNTTGFDAGTLVMAVSTVAWLAHRLPAGDPIRAALPGALASVHERLANPDLMLDLGRYVDLVAFKKAAGVPTETGEGYLRYGSLILATHDNRPAPGVRTALFDGDDPYLRALIASEGAFAAEIALRTVRDPSLKALVADPGDPVAGERDADGTWWPQDPTRSVPELVAEVAGAHALSADAAAVYLMLLAMPDPTDRNLARWTGWKPARLKAARAELVAIDLVVEATRSRAGRRLFLPGGWTELPTPSLPLEQWKLEMFRPDPDRSAPLVPLEPVAALYARAWGRVREGDVPRFEELKVRRGRRR
ncbi:DNA-binding protein [Nonomuraea sp. NPDC050643]|uniref:DNA-binding protein n=1 Tax=Nonomuraea sp. NPDC050643 TaxID=3155660 RepID=UPI0033F8C6A8